MIFITSDTIMCNMQYSRHCWCYLSLFVMMMYCFSLITAVPPTWWSLDILPWRSKHSSVRYSNASTKHSIVTHNPALMCMSISAYSASQNMLCSKYFDHMPAVTIGAKIAIEECQRQLKYRHWNCTIPHNSALYGRYNYLATKEAAFAHAISTAGVVHAIARSCREARITTCGCSQAERPPNLHRDWLWGGCGDNLLYAYWFAKHFLDSREKESRHGRGSRDLANILVNLHNNQAGRMAVYKMSSVACKCHGVSGSCSLRSCWRQLPPFIQIGHHLTQRYDNARRVKFNKRGTRLRKVSGRPRRPAANELIYSEISPDYCELSQQYPGFEISGRECRSDESSLNNYFQTGSFGRLNRHRYRRSNHLPSTSYGSPAEFSSGGGASGVRHRSERCNLICCSRGYRTFTREVHEKCHCRFIWCCKIQCQMCIRLEQVHVCN